jgi:hypothetical protein
MFLLKFSVWQTDKVICIGTDTTGNVLFQDGGGMKLFMLYKATQTVIEKAPIDAVTGNSRNTLAEERLLKNRVEFETLVKIRMASRPENKSL